MFVTTRARARRKEVGLISLADDKFPRLPPFRVLESHTFPRLETTKPIENFFAARGVAYKSDSLTAEKRKEDFAAEIEKMVKG